jgi:hypothetical protein
MSGGTCACAVVVKMTPIAVIALAARQTFLIVC